MAGFVQLSLPAAKESVRVRKCHLPPCSSVPSPLLPSAARVGRTHDADPVESQTGPYAVIDHIEHILKRASGSNGPAGLAQPFQLADMLAQRHVKIADAPYMPFQQVHIVERESPVRWRGPRSGGASSGVTAVQ